MSRGSNTHECFTELIGRRVVGVLFAALPLSSSNSRNTTLVLDDGTGFTFNHEHGSYWWESADDVRRAVARKQRELADTQTQIEGVLALAGTLSLGEGD